MYVDRLSVPLGHLRHRAALNPRFCSCTRIEALPRPWFPLSGVEANPARESIHHCALSELSKYRH
jgi:hypothetical protein